MDQNYKKFVESRKSLHGKKSMEEKNNCNHNENKIECKYFFYKVKWKIR